VIERSIASRGRQDCRIVDGGKLSGAGEEVGMKMGVRGERNCEVARLRRAAKRAQVQTWIDRERVAVTEIDELAAVS